MMRLCKKRTILISGLILVGGLLYGFWPLSERSDHIGYYAPCWGKGNRIFFIKNVTYGHEARYTPLNSWLTRAVFFGGSYIADKSEVYLCSMNWDGTDKKEIVKLGTTEDKTYWLPLYLDYCEANNSLLLSGGMHPARGEAYDGICTIKADGSEKRKISDVGLHASWSPDGKRLVYRMRVIDRKVREDLTVEYCKDYGSLWVMDVDGNNKYKIFSGEVDEWVESPIWSPKGDLIAFVYDGWIWVMRPDGGGRRRVCERSSYGGWSPDGTKLYVSVAGADEGMVDLNGQIIKKFNWKELSQEEARLLNYFPYFEGWKSLGKELSDSVASKQKKYFIYKRPNNIW